MSGKPNQTPSDVQRNKIEYMEYLQNEIDMDNINLRANTEYLQNGTLPPTAQILDTRSTSEILADGEKLKTDLANEFKELGSLQFGLSIFDRVINSKLNVGNKFLRFVAQNAPDFVSQLKRKYKYGIEGDADDVDIIVQFLERLFTDKNAMFQTVKGYIQSNTGTIGQKSQVMGVNDIDKIISSLDDYIVRMNVYKSRNPRSVKIDGTNKDHIKYLIKVLKEIKRVIPTREEMNELTSIISSDDIGFKSSNADDINEVFKLLEKLPKASDVSTLLDFLLKSGESGNNKEVRDILQKLFDLFTPFYNEDNLKIMENFDTNVLNKIKTNMNKKIVDNRNNLLQQQKIERGIQDVRVVNNPNEAVNTKISQTNIGYNYQPPPSPPSSPPSSPPTSPTGTGLRGGYKGSNRGRIRGCGITPIVKPPTFVGFGINEINIKKLNDKCIFTLRRNTRSNIKDIPSKHVSDRFRNVINSIIGKGIANIDDINNLDDEEKDYLYKIVKTSNMSDKLSVPAPKKDNLEKVVHQFEVMKGQIMSGNDNKDLIKKFKLLIIKLSKEGLLPRNEVNDLLEQLVMLGY